MNTLAQMTMDINDRLHGALLWTVGNHHCSDRRAA